jgi:2-polyprenyl-3-methyl-5-hydroxy-6-metoxy-1,4-benzoquinol methylase
MTTTDTTSRAGRLAAIGFDYRAQPRHRVDACNLCGGSRFVALTHRDRYGYEAEGHACLRCGLVFLNPVMTAAAYGRFYQHVYRPLVSAYHGRTIDAVTLQPEQRVYAGERVEFLRPYLAASNAKTLLDIGGSTGVVAHALAREFALEATVIDPAPLEVAEARALGLETVTGLVEQHDFGARRFDVVVICQTVDHLLDIAATLRRVRDLLNADGILFVDIVDFRAAYLRHWSVEEAIKIDHPYYLTEATMEAFLRRFGFEISAADYAADHLHVGYACRAGRPDADALPSAASVAEMLREIRYVQNAPR